MEEKRMDLTQVAEECVQIEKAGGCVLDHLKALGCISPWGTWFRMQKEQLGRKDWQITDGKGDDEMRKVTLEQKKKAVEIAIGGGDPLKFLEECGSANPSAHWYYIKKTLKEKDPEKYEQIPGAAEKKDSAEPDGVEKTNGWPEGFVPLEKKGRRNLVTTCCAPSTREGVEVPDELPEEEPENLIGKSAEIIEKRKDSMKDERKPVNYDGYDVSAIRSEALGEFYFDRKFNSLDWRTAEGEEIGMSPERWKMLMNELPKIMGILGI